MIKYRSYVDYGKGYQNIGTHNPKRTINILDNVILTNNTDKLVLVIECNLDDNSESPILFYNGFNKDDYIEFRESLIKSNNIKTLKKNN